MIVRLLLCCYKDDLRGFLAHCYEVDEVSWIIARPLLTQYLHWAQPLFTLKSGHERRSGT